MIKEDNIESLKNEFEALKKALNRERNSRKEAERTIEEKSRQIYNNNLELKRINEELDNKVKERTAELELNKEELEKALKVRDSFLKSLGHEIYTPLNIIQGNLDLFETENEDNIRILDTINIQLNQLYSILKILIRLAEIESGKIKAELLYTDLHEITLTIISYFRASLNRNKVNINVKNPFKGEKFEINRNIVNYLFQQIFSFLSGQFQNTTINVDWEIQSGSDDTANIKMLIDIPTEEKFDFQSFEKEDFLFLDPTNTNKYSYFNLILGTSKRLLELIDSTITVNSFENSLTLEVFINKLKRKENVEKSDFFESISEETKTVLIKKFDQIKDSMIYDDYENISDFLKNFENDEIKILKNELDSYIEEFNLQSASQLIANTIGKLND